METKLIDVIDFERVNSLLEGFNKATGFVTAILDLDGNILSKSGWRDICTQYHRVHPDTSARCTESDTCLSVQLREGAKYNCYKCLNGLVDVAVPIIINDEHIGNLFTGQLLFEKPNKEFFRKQAADFGFEEAAYLAALDKVPIISERDVTLSMDFLLNMTELISEMTLQRKEQAELVQRLKESEDKLLRALEKAEESDRLKSAFLANMSHEIRTPMNGILGFAELLKEPNLPDEEHQEYIQIIERSGKRMLGILNEIIDISRIEAGLMTVKMAKTNVNEILDFMYKFFKPEAEAKGLHFSCDHFLPFQESVLITDKEKIYAILTNLVKNALKYTDKGFIRFGAVRMESRIEFFVQDSGLGIAEERQKAIFERFVQADIEDKRAFQGAGLGLAISKALVNLLGGNLWLESELGIGSKFQFDIPFVREAGIALDQPAGDNLQKQAESRRLNILIVEDDEISGLFLKKVVNNLKNKLLLARNGHEAVSLCREHPDLDLILMDVGLPDMNGLEATRKIRTFNKKVVVIAATAYGFASDKENSLRAGCNDYLSKPIDAEQLRKMIEKYCN